MKKQLELESLEKLKKNMRKTLNGGDHATLKMKSGRLIYQEDG